MIYLDHAATTPLHPRVLEAMAPYLKDAYGNPSSVHTPGRRIRFAVDESRERVAAALGAEPGEIIFTSGATESINTGIRSALVASEGVLVTSGLEHKAVLRVAEYLETKRRAVRYVTPTSDGDITLEAVEDAAGAGAGAVALMWVNNETGRATPVRAVSGFCRSRKIPFYCDAVQAVLLMDVNLAEAGPDMLSLSAHKLYGPKGVGLLYVRGGTDFTPLIRGGAQERNRRGGTENVPGIIGFAEALALAVEERDSRREHVAALHVRARNALRQALDGPVVFHSPDPERQTGSPHILSVGFPPVRRAIDGEMLLLNLDVEGIYLSGGSACTSGAVEPSHVLRAMGVERETAEATLRISFGTQNTEEEVDRAVEAIAAVVRRLRN